MTNSNPAYEVKPSEGKGLGLFATRDIAAGELILAEKPLFTASDAKHISDALSQLSEEQKKAFHELLSGGGANGTSKGDKADSDEATFRRLAIALTRPGTEGHERLAVFTTISRINHSCSPNVCVSWNEQHGSLHRRNSSTAHTGTGAGVGKAHEAKGQETVYAIMPIKAGDELYTQNFPVYNTQTARKKYSQQSCGFTCSCPACSAAHDPESDARRVRIGDLDDEIAWAKAPNPMQGYKFAQERLRLTDAEGLAVPLESSDTHLEAYDICLGKKDYHAAQRHALLALGHRIMAQGSDYPVVHALHAKEMEARRNLPKYPTKTMPMLCARCGAQAADACTGCKAALYCGDGCKEGHRELHEPVCRAIQMFEADNAK